MMYEKCVLELERTLRSVRVGEKTNQCEGGRRGGGVGGVGKSARGGMVEWRGWGAVCGFKGRRRGFEVGEGGRGWRGFEHVPGHSSKAGEAASKKHLDLQLRTCGLGNITVWVYSCLRI